MTPHETLLQLDPYIPINIISHDYPGIYGVAVRYSWLVAQSGEETARENDEVARLLHALKPPRPFQRHDHVWVGDPGDHKTTWEIDFIDPRWDSATLVSGLTGKRQYNVPLSSLTLHTPASEGAIA